MFERLSILFRALWGKYKSRPLTLLFFGALALGAAVAVTMALFFDGLPRKEIWVPLACAIPVVFALTYYFTLVRASQAFVRWYDASEVDAFEIAVLHAIGSGQLKISASKGRLDLTDKTEEERAAFRIKMAAGVPVLLTLSADTAVVTELNGKPHRVIVEPGKHTLLPFEQIRYTIDRRAHTAFKGDITAMTRDGVTVTIDAVAGYQIRRKGQPSVDNPFPVDEIALLQSAYRRIVQGNEPEPPNLDKLMPQMLSVPVQNVVAQYRLSDLFEHSIEGLEAENRVPRARFGAEVKEALESYIGAYGLEITFVSISRIEVSDENIRKHMVEHWAREREHEIERRVVPVEARLKADQALTMLRALQAELAASGQDVSVEEIADYLRDIEFIYYHLSNLVRYATEEEGKGFLGPVTYSSPRSFKDIESGRFDTPQEVQSDRELARRFPGMASEDNIYR
ncbi:MAG: hypothetical protein Kow00120_25830 [Anaerolineae bacterium]